MTTQLKLFETAYQEYQESAHQDRAPGANGDGRLWYVQNTDGESMRKFTLRALAAFLKKFGTQPAIVLAHRDDLPNIGNDLGIEVREGRIPSQGQLMIGYVDGNGGGI